MTAMIGISHEQPSIFELCLHIDRRKDVVLERQCVKCKEIVTQRVLNGFVVMDEKGRLSTDTWDRLKRYSDACFEEEHKCKGEK